MTEDQQKDLLRTFGNNTDKTKVYYMNHKNRAFEVSSIETEGAPIAMLENSHYSVSLITAKLSDFALMTRLAD